MSANVRYLGLSIPELAINMIIFSFYIIVLDLLSIKTVWPAIVIQVILNIVYFSFINKLEENIINVILINRKIPNVVQGFSNKMKI